MTLRRISHIERLQAPGLAEPGVEKKELEEKKKRIAEILLEKETVHDDDKNRKYIRKLKYWPIILSKADNLPNKNLVAETIKITRDESGHTTINLAQAIDLINGKTGKRLGDISMTNWLKEVLVEGAENEKTVQAKEQRPEELRQEIKEIFPVEEREKIAVEINDQYNRY